MTPTEPKPADKRDVTVKSVHPAALAHAMRLANGDRSRLRFEDDGTVTVTNEPRIAHRPVR